MREGLDGWAGAQPSAPPALPDEWDGVPLGHPSPAQEAINDRAQVWVDSAKERGRRRPQTFSNYSEHSWGVQGPLVFVICSYYLSIVIY